MTNVDVADTARLSPTKPFRDETKSLIDAAERDATDHLNALDAALAVALPKSMAALESIYCAVKKMTSEEQQRYVQQRGVKKNGNVQNPFFYLVRAMYQDDSRISKSQYTKYAGTIALAIAIKPVDMPFVDFVKEHGGIEGANEAFAKSKALNRTRSEIDHTRRVEAIHREIAAYLRNPVTPSIDAPEFAAGLQEGLDYIAVIRKVDGRIVILRTLDYERTAITRMLHRFAVASKA